MGLFEPETITLFDGWIRLLFFAAGAINLILSIESYLDREDFYENVVTHIYVVIGSLWFTCELIYIPNQIFGNSTDEGGLINILRSPWSVAMGIFAMMSMGVIHESDLITDDIIIWSRVPLIGLSIILAVTQQLLGFDSQEWDHGNDVCHGWKVKRWYERSDLPPPFELVPGININLFLAFFLVITPGASIYAEMANFFNDDITFNQQITHASVVGIDLILLMEALLYATKFKVAPVHLFTVFTQFYVASKASVEIGGIAYALPLFSAVPLLLIEIVFGSAFGDYAEFLIINIRPRSMYRLVYVIAIWTGVFSIVAWTVGWYGKWITLDIENGSIVQLVLDALDYLEQSIAKFLFNLVNIVNFLTVCGRKTIDPTLTAPEPLDLTDNVEEGVEIGNFVMNIRESYIEFFNGTVGKDPHVITKQCCVCSFSAVNDISATEELEYACAATPDPNFPPRDSNCPTDGFFQDIIKGNAHPEDIMEIVNYPGSTPPPGGVGTCRDPPPTPTPPPLSEEEEEQIVKDEKALGDLLEMSASQGQTVYNANGRFDRPAVVPQDSNAWEDPAENALASDATCEKIQCGVFVAGMIAATASAFIPFVGGAVAFVAKTALKIAFKIFRFVRKYYMKFIRMNRRRKKFRQKRKRLEKVINAVKQARLLAAKGIQATEDLIFPFLALFALGIISFFTAFWRREDSGEARSILGGIMIGLLIANVVSMLLVRFIPMAMKGIAEALPESLIVVTVKTHTGWQWMEYGVFSSLCSSVFWGLSMLLGQPNDDCEKYSGGSDGSSKPAAVMPAVEDVQAKKPLTLVLKKPKWTGRGYHPHPNKTFTHEQEKIGAPSYKSHPLLHTLSPIFNNEDSQKKSTQWINNIIWMIPVVILIYIAFDEGMAVFKVTANIKSEVYGRVTEIAAEEGSQEFVKSTGDDTQTICDIVELAVSGLLTAAGKAVGEAVSDSIEIVADWFKRAFYDLRALAAALVDLPDIPIWYLVDNTTLLMAYGCPILASVVSVIGFLLSILPLPSLFYEFVNLEILRSFQYMLAISGISICLTMYGITASISAVPIPMFTFKIETTHALLNAVLCNVIIIASFLNGMFNGFVPLYDRKQE